MIIDGINIAEKNLILTKVPPVTKPQKRVRRITIPGRSGFLTEWSGDYESYIKSPEFLYTGTDINDVLNFLESASLIVFPNDPGFAYEVRAEEKIDGEYKAKGACRIVVPYTTQPLKRLAVEVPHVGSTSYTLTNPGTEPAYPKISVTGAGEKTLTVGEREILISFTAEEETITIDSLNGQVYIDDTNAWNKITGDLPVIPVSDSVITISTTGSALTVYPNWRWT